MINKSVFLARSRNPSDELRVVNFLELARSLNIQVTQHYWNRELQERNHDSIPSPSVQDDHIFAYEAGYNKAFGSLIGQLRWQAFMFSHMVRERPRVIYACDLDSAVIPAIYRRMFSRKKTTLFFDEFDRFSTRSDNFGKFSKKLFSFLEKFVRESSNVVVVASNERQLQNNDIVILNFPTCESEAISSSRNETPKVSYVGLIQDDRGLRALIEALRQRENWSCFISGFGSYIDEIRPNVSSNVKIQGELSQSATFEEFSQAWLTIATYDPNFQNNRFSASTKVLQSLLVNTPVIVAKGGILEEIVTKNGLGWTVEYNNSVEIAIALDERELWSERDLKSFKENVKNYIAKLRDQQNLNLTKLSEALTSRFSSL